MQDSAPETIASAARGGRPIVAQCLACGHEATIAATDIALPGETEIANIGRRMRCTGCGRRGALTRLVTSRAIRQGRVR